MNFLTLVTKNLLRRPGRLALTTLGMALAVAAIVALVGLAEGFERSFRELYNRRGIDMVVQHAGGVMMLTRGVDESLRPRIEQVAGVREVIGGLTDVVSLEKFSLYAVIVNGYPADSPLFDRVTVTSGRRLQTGDKGRMMIGKILAANTGTKVGDALDIYGEPYEIVGIFESFSVYENGSVFLLLSELQRLTDRPGKVTGFLISTTEPDDAKFVEDVRARVEKLAPSISVSLAADLVRSVSQFRVARAAAWTTSAIAILIGVAGTLNTMMMSVFERVREIGTLRAIGWRKGRVVALVLCEALLISLLAAVLGTGVGIATIRLMTYWPKVSGLIGGSLPPLVIVEGCLVALLIGVLGAAYPAYWASKLSPVQAMRAK